MSLENQVSLLPVPLTPWAKGTMKKMKKKEKEVEGGEKVEEGERTEGSNR